MEKTISVHQNKYTLDLETEEGRDLNAAFQLVSMFGMPPITEQALTNEAAVALAEARVDDEHPQNPSYLAAAKLCSKYNTQAAHHIAYLAYRNLPAKYRPMAIQAMQQVLSFTDVPALFTYMQGLELSKEHRFDEAIAHIKAAIAREPHDPLYHVWLAKTLVKTNDIDAALSVLYEYRQTEYYKSGRVKTHIGNQTMQQMDLTIKDIEDKKARGYVFRPRKKRGKE